ncbi:MAG: UvrD-helicase domain-containing protein [Candidatus Marinimicrobia bacterium]|nr:UvrD-helicase domain-containing protein [Candidatus Neomarinimicrobiota bacterium]MBL7046607.1 UvrD-helicase domain-containing protein [Candidatus Neomarinimicrobiota bacterium]
MSILKLNNVQKEAVEYVDGPVLIFAGAGSGKTRVLTHKIAYLIQEAGYEPENILAVTFTNKAADEMRNRVERILGTSSVKVNIGTFHSICAGILRKDISILGFSSDFTIYDNNDQDTVIKSLMLSLEIQKDEVSSTAIRSKISLMKNRMENWKDLNENITSILDDAVIRIYPEYETTLKMNNALDFDDLLLFPLRLFEKKPSVLKKYQNHFKYILVDEYQDTNHPQFKFIKWLSEKNKHLCVVGDDDQSIYGWRGADISNIIEFKKSFPESKVFTLEQNYRSTQTILSSATAVVKNNEYRAPKTLWTDLGEGESIGLMETFDDQEEAEGVMELLEKEIMLNKRTFRNLVILYRINAQSRSIEESLRRRGIAYIIVGGIKFYARKEVKDLLAYLRLVINPLDRISLKRVINFPPRGVGVKTVEKCENYASEHGLTLFDTLKTPDAVGLKGKQVAGLVEFYQTIKKYQKLRDSLSASELVSVLLDELGLVRFYKEQATKEATERLENIQELVNGIHDFCEREEGAGIREFLEEVALLTDIDDWDNKSNAVTLMTLHSAKGLEFPVVFIVGMEDGLLPHSRNLEDKNKLEEERRLFYVGLTRAKEKVYLHYATNRRKSSGVGGTGIASRFLQEIPNEFIERITFQSAILRRSIKVKGSDRYTLKPIRTVTAFDDLQRGDKVEHKLYGKGMVLAVDGSGENQKITVHFRGNIRKKLIAKYANLRKL